VSGDRRTKANRINARASTGPRTVAGKGRAARNAQRHGLSLPALADPAWSEDIKALAREIAGDQANAEQRELACRVAAAHIDVMRVRQARHQMMAQALEDPNYIKLTNAMLREKWLRREYGWPADEERPEPGEKDTIDTPEKYAQLLADLSVRLALMDRYERRARSRRKFAIRAFDSACIDALGKTAG
jgi:hypothetical protein